MKKFYLLLVLLLVLEFILAAICGPYSCEWGNDVYFYSGIGILPASFILPFFRKSWTAARRIGFGLLFVLAALVVWVIGFMVCDFRIMCRMF